MLRWIYWKKEGNKQIKKGNPFISLSFSLVFIYFVRCKSAIAIGPLDSYFHFKFILETVESCVIQTPTQDYSLVI